MSIVVQTRCVRFRVSRGGQKQAAAKSFLSSKEGPHKYGSDGAGDL